MHEMLYFQQNNVIPLDITFSSHLFFNELTLWKIPSEHTLDIVSSYLQTSSFKDHHVLKLDT